MLFKILDNDDNEKDSSLHIEATTGREIVFKESEIHQIHRLITEHASDMIGIIDPESLCFSYVSPVYKKLLRYDQQELLGSYSLNLVHPDDREEMLEALLRGIEDRYGRREYRALLRDGTEIWLESIGELLDEQDISKGILLISRDINERKKIEEIRQYSEEKDRLILDLVYDMIERISTDDFRYLYVNQATLYALGFTKEEMLGRNSLELIHPEDRGRLMQKIGEGIFDVGEGIAEYRYQKKDGSYLWVEGSGRILITDNGNKELLFINRDISKRKIAGESLRKSELQLRQITDNMLDSICSLNEKGLFEYVSYSHKSILGFEPEEMMGKYNHQLLHPDDCMRVIEFVQNTISNELTGKIEYRAQHKEGHYVWMESVCKVFVDDYNKKKQLVACTRDISSRKQAETDLQQREEELHNKVNYLNTLIDNINELCYTLDKDYRLTFGNQKTLDVTGYTMEEGLGRSIFDFIPDTDKEIVKQNARRRLEDGKTGSYEHHIICKDGSQILVKVKSSPIIEDGEITGSLVLAEDITQQRKIEKEMTRLGQLNTIGEMAASIGHEIRNPMTTVQGFLQIMSQNEQLKEHQPYFDLMIEELSRANSIITEFLSLAKDKLVNLQHYNLNKIMEAIAPLLIADAIKGDKYINFKLGDVPDLLLDEKEIRQLILNLVRNGLEAMSAGGEMVIKTMLETDEVVLSVQDEGDGIVPEIREHLGTPFLSSKENGIGLGLAVCYSIVARHHAKMDFVTGSAGTVFRVKFAIR